jgi:glycyl-tRNA synthetase beta chain
MQKKRNEAKAAVLVELLTEELPPKSLSLLGKVFADEVANGLIQYQLKQPGADWKGFSTPRRLAVLVPDVLASGEDRSNEVAGPSAKAPPEAVAGFARKQGVQVTELVQRETPKGLVYVARTTAKGASLDDVLEIVVKEAVRKLPIAKTMRWGEGDAHFVRPVHGLVMMHGSRVVPGEVLGLESGNRTAGHRFLGKAEIALKSADEYEAKLEKEGKVIADFVARRSAIEDALKGEAKKQKASLGQYQDLLDEVTALVELPAIYTGTFPEEFLSVPQECLILTMRQNQKYFPLFGAGGKLLPRFLIVSNMEVRDPRHIVGGNERVVRPRLQDARFFFDQDRKTRLEDRVQQLARVVYHRKLGTQSDRVQRIELLAGSIARKLGADAVLAERAARLAKADLLTGMVGEFPELEGIMGRHYAILDKEPQPVADAIEGHYRPRYAGGPLPEGDIACSVALADKLDAIAGLFGIGEQPTGEKDPFGLRRAALGIIRIVVEHGLKLSLRELVSEAFDKYQRRVADAHADVHMFLLNRFEGYLKDRGFSTLQVDAVLGKNPDRFDIVPKQLEAVRAFETLPEAASLAAANKRVANILRQAESKGESFQNASFDELKEPAERALLKDLREASQKAGVLFDGGDYAGYLKTFAVLKPPIDAFFDAVMVMVDDATLRRGRLALLRDLRDSMNKVADISRLAK